MLDKGRTLSLDAVAGLEARLEVNQLRLARERLVGRAAQSRISVDEVPVRLPLTGAVLVGMRAAPSWPSARKQSTRRMMNRGIATG